MPLLKWLCMQYGIFKCLQRWTMWRVLKQEKYGANCGSWKRFRNMRWSWINRQDLFMHCILDAILFLSPSLHTPPSPGAFWSLPLHCSLSNVFCSFSLQYWQADVKAWEWGNTRWVFAHTLLYCREGTPDRHSLEFCTFVSLFFTKVSVQLGTYIRIIYLFIYYKVKVNLCLKQLNFSSVLL